MTVWNLRLTWLAAVAVLTTACSAPHGETQAQSEKQQAAIPGAALSSMPEIIELPQDAPQLKEIDVQPAEVAAIAGDEIVAPGVIEADPNRISHVSVPVSGRITAVLVRLGDVVSEFQPLFEIESPEIEAAELAHRQAQSALAQARANQVKAQADLDRLNDLFAHEAVAQKEVVAARNTLTLVEISVKEADGVLQQTLRRMELLGLKPGSFGQRMIVRSPLAGKVLALSLVAGEYRNDLSAPVLTVADLRTVWASSKVPESYIRHCRIGGRVLIELVAFPGELFQGRVSHIADTVDPDTRTVKVHAELSNTTGRFRPEMFGRIRYGEPRERLPIVPRSAILQYEGQTAVFVEERPGRFVRRPVVTGSRSGENVVIREGLRGGERVVIAGAIHLKGGI